MFSATSKNLEGRTLEDRKEIWGDAEVEVQAARDHRSCISMALSADFLLIMAFGRIFAAHSFRSFSTVSVGSGHSPFPLPGAF